jgi:hypothetical protein
LIQVVNSVTLVLSGDIVEDIDVVSAIANAYASGKVLAREIPDEILEEFSEALASDRANFRM